MSESTDFIVIRQWQDEPEPGKTYDDWPFPDEHVISRIEGGLADKVRERFGVSTDEEVTIEELIISGGYSECTRETYYEFAVRCGVWSWHSKTEYMSRDSGLRHFLKWVDGE